MPAITRLNVQRKKGHKEKSHTVKTACDFSLCSKRDLNPHRRYCPRDFKSLASRHSSSFSETLYIFVNQPFISPQGRIFPVKNKSRFTSRFTHKVQNNVIVNRIGLYRSHKINKTLRVKITSIYDVYYVRTFIMLPISTTDIVYL